MLQLYVDSSTAGDTWALEGELTIQVDTADTLESRAGGPGVVQVGDTHHSVYLASDPAQANTTLLVVCVLVFTIFLSLLLGVAVMFGRSRLDKVAELGNTSKGRISNGV